MAARKQVRLTLEELRNALDGRWSDLFPPILSPQEFAGLLAISRKTVYLWLARGRLDGAVRKRGKHVFILRDRALRLIFDGPNWPSGASDAAPRATSARPSESPPDDGAFREE